MIVLTAGLLIVRNGLNIYAQKKLGMIALTIRVGMITMGPVLVPTVTKENSMEKKENKTDLAKIAQILQVFVLAIGLAGVFIRLGESQAEMKHNNTQLVELKEIVQDLVRSQVEFVSNDARLEERMDALRTRIDRLESN